MFTLINANLNILSNRFVIENTMEEALLPPPALPPSPSLMNLQSTLAIEQYMRKSISRMDFLNKIKFYVINELRNELVYRIWCTCQMRCVQQLNICNNFSIGCRPHTYIAAPKTTTCKNFTTNFVHSLWEMNNIFH